MSTSVSSDTSVAFINSPMVRPIPRQLICRCSRLFYTCHYRGISFFLIFIRFWSITLNEKQFCFPSFSRWKRILLLFLDMIFFAGWLLMLIWFYLRMIFFSSVRLFTIVLNCFQHISPRCTDQAKHLQKWNFL